MRRKSEYKITVGGERTFTIIAETRKDAIHQAWRKLDPEIGGNRWDEISVQRRHSCASRKNRV